MESFWAITCYFNPCGYQNRLLNYKIFRKFLNVPLITVELSYNNSFELQQGDADILIQIKGKDVMWQKERLLNIALQHLPNDCEKFAWLDCDIIFYDNKWVEEAIRLLDKFKLIHLFKNRYDCNSTFNKKIINSDSIPTDKNLFFSYRDSIAFLVESIDKEEVFRRIACRQRSIVMEEMVWSSGLAWASYKDIFKSIGFYDYYITGSMVVGVGIATSPNYINISKTTSSEGKKMVKHLCPN